MRQLAIVALLAHACASAACTKTDPAQSAGSARAVPSAGQPSEDPAAAPTSGAAAPVAMEKLPDLPPLRPLGELACGKLPTRLASAPLSLLAGRLQIQPLEGARLQARGHSIMAAPEADEVETRVFLEHEGQKLVIMTHESLQLAGALSAASAVAAIEPMVFTPGAKLTAHALPTADARLHAVAVVPAALDLSDGEAVFVLGVVTALPDGTAQLQAYYVDPAAGAAGRACTDVALHVARTLRAGERTLVRSAGERALPGPGNLHIRVAQDWVLTTQEGPDFFVHRLLQLVPLGQTAPEIGVYVGHHPRRPEQPEPATLPGRLFGKAVTWAGPSAEASQRQVRQLIAELPGGEGLQAHVWMVAANQAGLAAVQAMAESLRVGSQP
jgi:hypothetical protein